MGDEDTANDNADGPEPRLLPWLALTAAVYFLGQRLPLPGIDHEAVAQLAAQSAGLLGLFDQAAPIVAMIGASASTLVVVQLVLILAGALDRPVPRAIGFVLYLVFSGAQAIALALWAESLNAQSWSGDIVHEPGWGFRLTALVGMLAGAALLWWVCSRIDRTGRAHGALFLSLLIGLERAASLALAQGQAAGVGQIPPVAALLALATPLSIVLVAAVLTARPERWPLKLIGPASLRSPWDAVALPTLGSVPFSVFVGTVGGVAALTGQSTGSSLGLVGAVFPLAIAIGFCVVLLRRERADVPRRWSPAVVAAVGLVLGVGGLAVGFTASGGIEQALAPGPLAGDASFGIVLEAEGEFASSDAGAMVERIEALGADATVESSDARRIALRVSNAVGVREVVDALRPHTLQMRFARSFEVDPLADVPGLRPEPSQYVDWPGTKSWRADCATAREVVDRPVEGCDLAVEPDADEEGWCTLHCLDREVLVDASDIAGARVASDQYTSTPSVMLELEPAAADRFEAATGANLRRVLAIVVDGEVVSAPVVQSAIPGGRVQITLGSMADYDALQRDARALAHALRPGARISTDFVLAEERR